MPACAMNAIAEVLARCMPTLIFELVFSVFYSFAVDVVKLARRSVNLQPI